jgi:hypothetical protein
MVLWDACLSSGKDTFITQNGVESMNRSLMLMALTLGIILWSFLMLTPAVLLTIAYVALSTELVSDKVGAWCAFGGLATLTIMLTINSR